MVLIDIDQFFHSDPPGTTPQLTKTDSCELGKGVRVLMASTNMTLGGGVAQSDQAAPGSSSSSNSLPASRAVTDWLLRVGDTSHLFSALPFRIWGVNSKDKNNIPYFLRNVKPGDRLWFISGKSQGKAVVVATFVRHAPRELGPLVQVTRTDEELGWTHVPGEWDTEVHYADAYDIRGIDIHTKIQSPRVVRAFNPEKCAVDLPQEYTNIVRYSRVRKA